MHEDRKLSLSLRTTSDIFASSQRKASATFCSTVVSLDLSSHSLREASISYLIGRAHSRDIARGRETTGTFYLVYNPAKSRHCISHTPFPKKDVPMPESAGLTKISKIPSNQRDIIESARFFRIDKVPSNQPDSSNPTDTRPRLSTNEPSPSTACHSLRVSAWSGFPSSRGSSDLFGFVGY